jgi:hypothetical protein
MVAAELSEDIVGCAVIWNNNTPVFPERAKEQE